MLPPDRTANPMPPPAPWGRAVGPLHWIMSHGGRRRGFQCGLAAAALLFIASLSISVIHVREDAGLEARLRRNSLWLVARGEVELSRLTVMLERHADSGGRVTASALGEQLAVLWDHIARLDDGEGAPDQMDMAHMGQHLPEIRRLLTDVEDQIRWLAAGKGVVAADIVPALDQVSHLLQSVAPQPTVEQVAAHWTGLTWTLLSCMGLVASAGLLLLLLRLESGRARRMVANAGAAERRQKQAEKTLRVLIDNLPAMVSAYDRCGHYLFFNEAYARFHGLREDAEPIGHRPETLGIPVDPVLEQVLLGEPPLPLMEFAAPNAEGRPCTLLATAVVVEDECGGAGCIVHVAFDITARKAAEDRVRHLAEHDALTDLPNRVLFNDRLDQALSLAGTREDQGQPYQTFALHFIDLDRFKDVNDALGHQRGDALLLAAAERLGACLRRDDTLARLGSDEFAIVQAEAESEEEAARLAARLVRVMALPFVIDGYTVHSGVSIGTVLAPAHGYTAKTLQQHAGIALNHAKAEGRGRAVVFSPHMAAALAERRDLEADLRAAIAGGRQLSLVYQPKFDLGLGQPVPVGCEALLRWHHPTRGLVSPASFVPITEEAGMAGDLSRLVLRLACTQIQAWSAQGLDIPVAVNLSAQHFASDQAVQLVQEALEASGVPARLLEIEVTEGVFIRNATAARNALAALRALGVRVALDDFGTGYSALGYLQHLPFDVVKIDRTFVRDLRPGYGSGIRIVDAIVRLTHGLGARVVAEGVEKAEQLDVLHRLGCDSVQGFLLSRPMPPEELRSLFAAQREAPGKVA